MSTTDPFSIELPSIETEDQAMTDQALKDSSTALAASWLIRGRRDGGRSGEKVVSFASPGDGGSSAPEERTGTALRDWGSALDLIREASEAIRITEERASDLEAQLQQVTTQAAEEMRRLAAQIMASEQRTARTEERLRAAEARANEAEAWLVRLHDAVYTAFVKPGRGASHQEETLLPHEPEPIADTAAE